MSPKVGVAPVQRARIVRATVRCLARHGYSGLTMRRVAGEAGVSQGILHYYFRDKRAMLTAALEAVTADLDGRVAAALGASGGDPRQALGALVRACLEAAVEAPEVWAVFVEFWGETMHDADLRATNARLYERLRRAVGALVARGQRAGRFRKVEAREAGAVVLALVDGMSLQLAFDPGAFDVAAATRMCTEALRRYLER